MDFGILRLVFDYSKASKIADANFIEKAIEIIVNEKSLHNYVGNLEFMVFPGKEDDNALASYDLLSHDITVYTGMLQSELDTALKFEHLFNAIEPILYRNLIIVQLILHELEHASQLRQIDSRKDDLETKLLSVCHQEVYVAQDPRIKEQIANGEINKFEFSEYIMEKHRRKKVYYYADPCERLAQINSYDAIINCIEPIKDYVPNVLMVEQDNLFLQMLRGYVFDGYYLSSPTIDFLKGTDNFNAWKSFDFYHDNDEVLQSNVEKQYTLQKRLTLGLPVRLEEYKRVYSAITTL